MSDPGDYYAWKERERHEAWARLQSARAAYKKAQADFPNVNSSTLEITLRKLRSAERAYELAAYVGD